MLPNAYKEDRDIGGMDETDEGSYHVADCVALGDDEAVKGSDGAKGGVKVASLSDRVCAY